MKKVFFVFIISLMAASILFGCNAPQSQAGSTETKSIDPSQIPANTTPPTAEPTLTRTPVNFPLAETGPYWVGNRMYNLIDGSRSGRKIRVQIFYPALKVANADGGIITRDAEPDLSGAPYPLILTGTNSGNVLFKSHLASHGFIMAIVYYPEWYDNWDYGIIDHPRDMLFSLDQIAANSLEGLEGVVDSDNVGVAGYSWEGFYSLALSGVRINPEYYLAYCKQAPGMAPALALWYIHYTCDLANNWDAFAAYAGEDITTTDDGLWQPIRDERIRAVMPMAVDGAWLYGKPGLAEVGIPVLMIQASRDSAYQPAEAAFFFEHLQTKEKSMISFVGREHMMVFDTEPANRMKHFAAAFFGYHLQGREDYREYFSEEFVNQVDDLAWGFYPEK